MRNALIPLCLGLALLLGCGDSDTATQPNDTMPDTESTVLRFGNFSGQNGYVSDGLVRVLLRDDGTQAVETGADFHVDGGAGSISLWLSNANGAVDLDQVSAAEKLRLGAITSGFNGVYSFDVPGDDSAQFTHVVTFCDGAKVNFGNAELREPS